MIAGRLRWLGERGKAAGQDHAGDVRIRQRHSSRSPKPEPSAARRCISSAATRRSRRSTWAASKCSTPTLATFAARLRSENHTLKRALTDPHLFSGIGNAYSDEILHRARLSPLTLTSKLGDERNRAALRRDARRPHRMDRAPARRGRRRIPGEGDRVPPGDGRPRQIRPALPGLRRAGAAHRVRRERMQLLRALPERRRDPGRPRAVAAAAQELAAVDRRTGLTSDVRAELSAHRRSC